MDKIISSLIDGASELSYHYSSENGIYWEFPKHHINSNKVLLSFLKTNENLKAEDFIYESLESGNVYHGLYDKVLFIEQENFYLVHDLARHLIYNYCLLKLKPYLSILKTNIINCNISDTSLVDNKFFYTYECMYKVENEIYSGIALKTSVKNLITRNWGFKKLSGHGYVINTENIEKEILRIEGLFNFSNVRFDFE